MLRLFLEVRYKRSPDSLCSSVIFTRMVSPFYYSADAALAILRPQDQHLVEYHHPRGFDDCFEQDSNIQFKALL